MTCSSPRRFPRRRSGQALTEFALTFPVLVALFMGTIEISRMLNVYVTANRIGQAAAIQLAAPDVTSTRPPVQGIAELRRQLRDVRNSDLWNQAYSPMILAMQNAGAKESYVKVDVNKMLGGRRFSEVEISIFVPPLLIPTVSLGGKIRGRFPITVRALALNETQGARQNLKGNYKPETFPLLSVLEHPDSPLPPARPRTP